MICDSWTLIEVVGTPLCNNKDTNRSNSKVQRNRNRQCSSNGGGENQHRLPKVGSEEVLNRQFIN